MPHVSCIKPRLMFVSLYFCLGLIFGPILKPRVPNGLPLTPVLDPGMTRKTLNKKI